ncbi:PilZ domain-containing protein [Candidatus Methylocalor cossyra]|uniref:PilZ domain-containing protein n=1 Tax=Candidatus Methylocalor cossyra TaxID=3108543 RepID=A0ABM9NI06_9GAMM
MIERRQHYRKRIRLLGYVVRAQRQTEFHVQDLSLDGLRGYFNGDPLLEAGAVVRIRLPALNLEGWATITRLEPAGKGRYAVGFCFDPALLHPHAVALGSGGRGVAGCQGL